MCIKEFLYKYYSRFMRPSHKGAKDIAFFKPIYVETRAYLKDNGSHNFLFFNILFYSASMHF